MCIFQNSLNAFTDAASSLHGCMLINGRVMVSTPEWSALSEREQILLCHLVNSLPQIPAARDIPIYLPSTSPNVSYAHLALHYLCLYHARLDWLSIRLFSSSSLCLKVNRFLDWLVHYYSNGIETPSGTERCQATPSDAG